MTDTTSRHRPRRLMERTHTLRGDGAILHEARLDRGWTQQQLADACDVRRTTISEWENGKVISPKSKRCIARVLGIFQASLEHRRS